MKTIYQVKEEPSLIYELPNMEKSAAVDRWINKILMRYYLEHPDRVTGNEMYFADAILLDDVQVVNVPRQEKMKNYMQVVNPVEKASAENAFKVLKPNFWKKSAAASVQFSQHGISDNWYQGGENNVNVLGDFVWNVKLNPNVYKKLLFENTVQYKVSVNSASQDSIRGYTISQDQFQINTKLGYKAIKNWYYSTNLRFKTQLLNNYKINTRDMKASVLSPADLNIGVGMTYSTALKNSKLKFDLSLSPLSMDIVVSPSLKMSIGPLANIVVFNLSASFFIISPFGFLISNKPSISNPYSSFFEFVFVIL